MPTAPKRPCRTPGCGALTDDGICGSCKANGALARDRPSAHARGYTRRWQTASKAYLRLNPFAVDIFNCFGEGRVFPAEVVDHIDPHKGDMQKFWNPANWMGLRKVDHDRKTALEQRGLWPPKKEAR